MNLPFVEDPNSIRKGPCTFVKVLKVDKFFRMLAPTRVSFFEMPY
jgi:hypothetical protein